MFPRGVFIEIDSSCSLANYNKTNLVHSTCDQLQQLGELAPKLKETTRTNKNLSTQRGRVGRGSARNAAINANAEQEDEEDDMDDSEDDDEVLEWNDQLDGQLRNLVFAHMYKFDLVAKDMTKVRFGFPKRLITI
jgi:hypothetical protein